MHLFRTRTDTEAVVHANEQWGTDSVKRLRGMFAFALLGAFLSGGIDSSIVSGLMAKLSDQPVKTFSIGFKEATYNELAHPRRVAGLWSTDHHESIVEPDALRHYGEPYLNTSTKNILTSGSSNESNGQYSPKVGMKVNSASSSFPHANQSNSRQRRLPSWRRIVFIGTITVAAVMCAVEGATYYFERRSIQAIAKDVIQRAGAVDTRSRIIALRDYVRANVSVFDAQEINRPFFRDSAAETLRSGKGFCGESTRAFICLADSVGIRAQRINLWGTEPHVVAEAEISPNDRVIVDCQNPPKIKDLETLDEVILRPEFTDYYTLNLRGLHLYGIVSRVKLAMGALTFWTENPHALKSLLWFLFGLSSALSWLILKSARKLLRAVLRKRGWIHVSNTREIAAAARLHAPSLEVVSQQH